MTISNPQIVSTVMAIGTAISILWLVRKDYLSQKDGIKWIGIAIGILLYGANPSINDSIGLALGISYPPIIVVLIGLVIVLVKLLLADIERAKMQMSVTRLIQKVSILEERLQKAEGESSNNTSNG